MTKKKLIGWCVVLVALFGSYNVMRLYLSMDVTDLIFAISFLIATLSAWIIERGGADETKIEG